MRHSTLLFHLTKRLLYTKWRDPGEEPKLHLFGQLKRITKQWLDTLPGLQGRHLSGAADVPGTRRHGLRADHGGDHRDAGRRAADQGRARPYNPTGSTTHVNFNTSKTDRWETDARRCHVNWVILDSDWEAEFCRVAEAHPRVRAYVKNHNLGLEVPYRYGSETRNYLPDFIVLVDDGHGDGRPAAPGRRDQGLPARGRQGEEVHHGDLLGARREQPRHATAAGPSPSSPTSTRSRRISRPKSKRSSTKMIDSVTRAGDEWLRKPAWPRNRRSREAKKTVETLTHEEATRKNIPTAEYQSVMAKEEQTPDPRGV